MRRPALLPTILIAGGLAWVLVLQTAIGGAVFFNGDGGIKFLLTRQFAAGEIGPDLRLPGPEWAKAAWRTGLYPFHPPFVYEKGDRYYAQYPVYFPLLSAPFYRLLGLRGLYVIPIAAIVVLWLSFLALCRRLGIGPWGTAAGLAALVFGSHLTLYAAMFWEHTLATALALLALSACLAVREGACTSLAAAAGGLSAGLSIWLRSEMILFAAILCAASILAWPRGNTRRGALSFTAATGVVLAVSFAVNRVVSGNFLGFHSWSVVYGLGRASTIALYPEIQDYLTRSLVTYLPMALVPIAFAALSWRDRHSAWLVPFRTLVLMGLAYYLLLPLILPSGAGREWGPRYLLVLAPIAALLAALIVAGAKLLRSAPVRLATLALVVAALGIGVARNVFIGTASFFRTEQARVLPALQLVLASPAEVVAGSRQWVSEDLAAAFERKIFFRTSTFADLARLASILKERGIDEFLYLNLPGEPPPPSLRLDAGTGSGSGEVAFTPAGRYGQFTAYAARITRF